MRVENLEQKVIRAGYEETTEDLRQLRCSGIFSTVWLAGPLAPVSGLPGVVLALPPASLPGLLFSTNEVLQTCPSSGTRLYWLSLARNAL